MNMKIFFPLIIFISLFFGKITYGQVFKLAAIYLKSGINSDFECITRGVIESVQKQEIRVSLKVFDNGGDLNRTNSAAEEIAFSKFDAAIGTASSRDSLIVAPTLKLRS